MKHKILIERECDGRFADPEQQELAAGRVWTIDGLINNTVKAELVKDEVKS